MEERIARVEGIIEEMRNEFAYYRNELTHLRSEHRSDFRMLLWVQIASWVTLMAAIIVTRF